MTHDQIISISHDKAREIMSALGPGSVPDAREANVLYSSLIDAIQNTILDHVTPEEDEDIAPEYGMGV